MIQNATVVVHDEGISVDAQLWNKPTSLIESPLLRPFYARPRRYLVRRNELLDLLHGYVGTDDAQQVGRFYLCTCIETKELIGCTRSRRRRRTKLGGVTV